MSNTQRFTAQVFLDSKDAEQRIDNLKKKMEQLRQEKVKALQAGDDKGIKNATKELKAAEKEMRTLQTTAQGVDRTLASLNTASVKELQLTVKAINRALTDGSVKRGTEQWRQLQAALSQCKTELNHIRQEGSAAREAVGGKSGGVFGGLTDGIAKLSVWTYGVEKALNVAHQFTQEYIALDEQMANVRKYTGQSAEEVQAMQKDLQAIDTRTSIEGLNELAGAAGRLGITSKESILEFVDAADKIGVALGDDLGDGAVDQIGKLAMAFGEDEKMGLRGAMLATGSAVNELSAKSAAQAGYLVDFTARLSGVGQQAGLTQAQIMGLGAVMDENMQRDETSTTALSQLITKMATDTATFARMAGVPLQEFSRMVKEDMNGALTTFFEAMQAKGGFTELAPMFSEMGMKGTQAAQVFSVIAGKIEDVKNMQQLATQAYKDATSVQGEFDVQNNTVAASIEKQQKTITTLKAEIGQQLLPVETAALTLTKSAVQVLALLATAIGKVTPLFVGLASVVAAVTLQVKIMGTAEEAAAASSSKFVKELAKSITKIGSARSAVQLLSLAINAIPWVAIGVGVAYAIPFMEKMIKKTNEMRHSAEIAGNAIKKATGAEDLRKSVNTAVAEYNRLGKEYNKILGTRNDRVRQGQRDVGGFDDQLKERRQKLNALLKEINDGKKRLAEAETKTTGKPKTAQASPNAPLTSPNSPKLSNSPNSHSTSNSPKTDGQTQKLLEIEQQRVTQAAELKRQYMTIGTDLYNNEAALNEALFKNDQDALTKKRDLYQQGSTEWQRIESDRVKQQGDHELQQRQDLWQQLEQMRRTWQQTSDEEQLKQSLEALEKFKQQNLISEEEYLQARKALQEKYAPAATPQTATNEPSEGYKAGQDIVNKARTDKAGGDQYGVSSTASVFAIVEARQQANEQLAALYEQDQITADEYNQLKKENNQAALDEIVSAASAAYSGMSNLMSAASAYTQACASYETAKIQAEYDKQIKAAGNNTKKKKKLEEKRDEELKKAKTKANEKAMKIELAQAYASTALAAINAYASASEVNWVLGAVAAAMATAAGMMQIATIKKQHQAEAEGYYSGGYTGGRRYTTEAGVVHEGEFVANHQAVNNRNLLPTLDLIDAAQRNNTVANLTQEDIAAANGMANGATVVSAPTVNVSTDNSQLQAQLDNMAATINNLTLLMAGGINAKVYIDGSDGLDAQYKRYQRLKR